MTRDSALAVRPDQDAMVRALGLLYIGGPSVAVACQLLPHSPRTDETAIWVMAAIAYSMVPVLFSQYKRLPPWAVGFMIVLANSLVTSVVYFNHEATSSYAFFYLWVTPYAAVFFSTRVMAAHYAYAALAYAAILAVHHHAGHTPPGGAEVSQWLQAMSALGVTLLLVRALDRSLRENLARVDEERRRRAIEINDDVVQRLVVARQAYAADERAAGDLAVDAALERARRIMAELIEADRLRPGSLRREAAAS
jgi:signal transduction histidine kinase